MVRRAQADFLGTLGLAAQECPYEIVGAGSFWRLRHYGGGGGPLVLIVAAPIKKPYVWDLSPARSALRYCLSQGHRIYLLEWRPAQSGQSQAGLADYVGHALADAVAQTLKAASETKLCLMGHSLGGTLAAIYATLEPRSLLSLVLLGAPLCFAPGASAFRDSLVALAPRVPAGLEMVPGSLLSHLSAVASPQTFIWPRIADAAFALASPASFETLVRIERWSLDEVPLPAKLVEDLVHHLYRDNSLCQGSLAIGEVAVGPSRLSCPALAVVNAADNVAPRSSVSPFLAAARHRDVSIVEYPGEPGVGLQHLAILVGPEARARVWPEINAWLKTHGAQGATAA
jgi:polyhydroxyalkanoate synthase